MYVPALTLNSGAFGVCAALLIPSAFGRYIIPAPILLPALTAPFLSAFTSFSFLAEDLSFKMSLFADKRTAASPVATGHAIDVPLINTIPPSFEVDGISTPGAEKSTQEPNVENDAR